MDWSKWKAFADNKINVAQMIISVFDRVENIVEKGENAFSPFPTKFSKGFFLRVVKSDCVVKSQTSKRHFKVPIAPKKKGFCLQNTSKSHSYHLKIW